MNKFFKRDQEAAPTPPAVSIDEARHFLPSSAKSPDAQRLNLFDPDEEIDENEDEDLAFLQSLTAEVATTPRPEEPKPKRAEPLAPAPAASASQHADDLNVFREIAALRQRSELAKQLRVDNVDMGDLLEDLQTTRAALRHHRKAA
jgi:hypothetical protein